tara:strand:+ start:2750 stop:3280 length:531 start_codon:yes stop_codon:yes gene_type:complete
MVRKRKLKKESILKFLLVMGIILSLFLVYEHFVPEASKLCKFGESFDCGIVNKSPYANIDGISYFLTIDMGLNIPLIDISGINWFFNLITSVAFLGFVTLLFVFGLLNAREKKKGFLWIGKKNTLKWIKGVLLFGVLFGIYLIFVQHYLLKFYCIFCLALDIILWASFIVVWRIKK